ncbi:MAG: TlpA family protein disulfide reductase [Acidimicrobiales bacterium]
MSFQPSQQPKSRAPFILVGVGVVVAVIAAFTLLKSDDGATNAATSTSAGTPSSSTVAGPQLSGGEPVITAPVTISGDALPPVPESGADPATGKAFPNLSGVTVRDGAPLTVAANGKPAVIIFVAHWCPHCQKEIPRLAGWLADNGAPADVSLFAVSTAVAEERGNFPPAAWLENEGWEVPTLADDQQGSAFEAAGLRNFPAFVVINAEGNVVQRSSGELSTDQFEALLDRARAGR